MSAVPTYFPYDGDPETETPPHRPGSINLGFDDLENDAGDPPNERTDPGANGWNNRAKTLVGLARAGDVLRISVDFDGADPVVTKVAAPGNLIDTDTITPTDNGVGDTTLTWGAGVIPPPLVAPHSLTFNTALAVGWAEEVTNGVRVRTFNLAGAPLDVGFTICIG